MSNDVEGLTAADFPDEPLAPLPDKWPDEKISNYFGTPENNWVPSDIQTLIEGICFGAEQCTSVDLLQKIYVLLGRNGEPTDIDTRALCGLPID